MRHAAHVAHHSRGRLRIRVPSAKGNPEALENIRQSLAKVQGVHGVAVNESIGTITIHYDPNHHPDFEAHLASAESHQEVVDVQAPPKMTDLEDLPEMMEYEAEFLAQHSHSAKMLFDMVHMLDNGIKTATDNAVDLKVIAPAALAVGAFLELGISAATPVWLTLGLFSFNHFIDLHTHRVMRDPLDPGQQLSKPPAALKRRKP